MVLKGGLLFDPITEFQGGVLKLNLTLRLRSSCESKPVAGIFPPQYPPRCRSGYLCLFNGYLTVDYHPGDSCGRQGGLLKGGSVNDCIRIKYDDVCIISFTQEAFAAQPESLSRQGRHFADGFRQREDALLPYIASQNPGKGSGHPGMNLTGAESGDSIGTDHGDRRLHNSDNVLLIHSEKDHTGFHLFGNQQVKEYIVWRSGLGIGYCSKGFPNVLFMVRCGTDDDVLKAGTFNQILPLAIFLELCQKT